MLGWKVFRVYLATAAVTACANCPVYLYTPILLLQEIQNASLPVHQSIFKATRQKAVKWKPNHTVSIMPGQKSPNKLLLLDHEKMTFWSHLNSSVLPGEVSTPPCLLTTIQALGLCMKRCLCSQWRMLISLSLSSFLSLPLKKPVWNVMVRVYSLTVTQMVTEPSIYTLFPFNKQMRADSPWVDVHVCAHVCSDTPVSFKRASCGQQ